MRVPYLNEWSAWLCLHDPKPNNHRLWLLFLVYLRWSFHASHIPYLIVFLWRSSFLLFSLWLVKFNSVRFQKVVFRCRRLQRGCCPREDTIVPSMLLQAFSIASFYQELTLHHTRVKPLLTHRNNHRPCGRPWVKSLFSCGEDCRSIKVLRRAGQVTRAVVT